VIIIGGGVAGCSTAYHLAKLGWTDVVLLERNRLTSGTTWHAAGLITTLRDSESHTNLAKYTLDLYRSLEAETGQAVGIIDTGSIQIAHSTDKAYEMRRGYHLAQSFGIEAHEIGAADVKKMWPLADVSDVVAAFYFPNDARLNPTDVTQALAKGARNRGVRIFENVAVTGIRRAHGRVAGVSTSAGDIAAEFVVNCAGMWSRSVGRMAGVSVPLQAAEHYYLISEPVAGVHQKLPILRDPGRGSYIREEAGKLLVGILEKSARPWGVKGIPENFAFGEIPPDWDHVMPYIEHAMKRVPVLLSTGIKLLFCGPESFTFDRNYMMGEAPNLRGFFVAAGFNGYGLLSGGGIGLVMAQWIVEGHPRSAFWSVSLRRVLPWQDNDRFLADRTVEAVGIGYQDHWPFRQWTSARGVKKSVLHERLEASGACFGESAGWECADWFATPGQLPEYRYSWGRQNWFDSNAAEHRSVRERVGLFDRSALVKLLVQGRDAMTVLNRIGAAELDVAVGRCVHTQFLNERGGIEADLTVTRLAAERFLVVTGAPAQTHVESWIRDHIPADAFCVVTDLSDAYVVLDVQGPASRALLQSVCEDELSEADFPFETAREVRIGYQTALAMRLTRVGELGWELYIPTPFALPVYDALVAAGPAYGLSLCGAHTANSLRIEKAYSEWPQDIGPDNSPIEAGLISGYAWRKSGGFIGREALMAQREAGSPRRRLVQFLLEDSEALAYAKEPIFRDGKRVGLVTSAMYGHTLGATVALGYIYDAGGVMPEHVLSGTYEIELSDRRVAARASISPLYDPDNSRVRK
jgi:4-methylaminobutanoate oxidase (formaldehyde-forming)